MNAGRSAGIVLALITVALLQAAPAQATEQDSRLQLSIDGISYSSSLPHPVLQSAEPIVPGGSIDAPVWVRNDGDDDAWLSVAALAGTVDLPLEETLRVRTSTDDFTGGQVPLGESGSCSDLAVGLEVPAGESVRLLFDLAFDVDAANDTRQQSADFALRLLMQDSPAGEAAGACDDPRGVVVPGIGSTAPGDDDGISAAPHGSLADTGASGVPWLGWAAAAIGLGALLLALVRRRRADRMEEQ